MIVRGNEDPVGTHSFDGSAGVVRRSDSVETGNPAQRQIVFGIKDIDTRISAFRKVVPRPRLIHPANVKSEWIARYEDRTDKFDGLVLVVPGTHASATVFGSMIRFLTRACAHSQSQC